MTNNFKLYGKCDGCGKDKYFIRKRVLKISGVVATSKKAFCRACYNGLLTLTK